MDHYTRLLTTFPLHKVGSWASKYLEATYNYTTYLNTLLLVSSLLLLFNILAS